MTRNLIEAGGSLSLEQENRGGKLQLSAHE
jgi:hypothetical protein